MLLHVYSIQFKTFVSSSPLPTPYTLLHISYDRKGLCPTQRGSSYPGDSIKNTTKVPHAVTIINVCLLLEFLILRIPTFYIFSKQKHPSNFMPLLSYYHFLLLRANDSHKLLQLENRSFPFYESESI